MTLMNPYAYVDNKLVTAAGVKNREMDFRCPGCSESLILRKGDVRVPHFAHKPNMPECAPDLITHKIAIDIICESQKAICYRYRCPNCSGGLDRYLPTEPKYSFVKEYKIGRYRADIGVLEQDEIVGVIEVCHTHKNEPDKVAYYNKKRIPYLEIKAQSIIDVHTSMQDRVELLDSNLEEFIVCAKCENEQYEAERAQRQKLLLNKLPWVCENEQQKLLLNKLPWRLWKKTYAYVCDRIKNMPIMDDETFESIIKKLDDLKKDLGPQINSLWKESYSLYKEYNYRIVGIFKELPSERENHE